MAIQVLRNAIGDGRVSDFPEKKRYEDVRYLCYEGVGVKFPEKKHYITHEWPRIGRPPYHELYSFENLLEH